MIEWLCTGMTLPRWGAIAALAGMALLALACFRLGAGKRKGTPDSSAQRPEGQVGQITVGKLHEQGAREEQQDCFALSDEALIPTHGLLAAVADGMGGLSHGGKVSQAAVQAVLDAFPACKGSTQAEPLLLALAQRAVQAVNDLLGPDGLRESGSTLVLGLVREESFSFLSIGDSRVALYRNGVLIQLNREHIYQRELALRMVNGELPLAQVYTSPKGAGLTSFLGMGNLQHIDLPAAPIRLLPGDRVILMSDGVYNALTDQELTQVLAQEQEPEQAAQAIRQAIADKNYQNQDNYTAVILACAPDEP